MCGIIGIVSKEQAVAMDMIFCLKELEYRGYDSSGIVFAQGLLTYKTIESIEMLGKMCAKTMHKTAIAHTRWATHGEISITNTHPIKQEEFSIVHNGIVENTKELLELTQLKPKTQTDTEILLATFIYLIRKNITIQEALKELLTLVKGSFSIAIVKLNEEKIFFAKKGLSQLIIAKNESKTYIVSSESAINEAAQIYEVPNNGYGYIDADKICIFPESAIKSYPLKIQKRKEELKKSTFLEEEINEQPFVLRSIMNQTTNINLKKYNFIKLIGCGSAYIACSIAKLWLEEEGMQADAEVASEWNCRKSCEPRKTLVILVSQSGETADTILAMHKAFENRMYTAAIVNQENSVIAKESNFMIHLNAGPEKSVASSKAFTSQLLKLFQLAKGKPNIKLPEIVKYILTINLDNVVEHLLNAEKIIIIGKNLMYSIALEGALKIKELTYLNTNAYSAGELKHGYLALVDENTTAIILNPDSEIFYNKTLSSAQEIITRKGKIVEISSQPSLETNLFIKMPKIDYSQTPILYAVIMQRIAFELAKAKNLPIDKPRNLAKSVTVE